MCQDSESKSTDNFAPWRISVSGQWQSKTGPDSFTDKGSFNGMAVWPNYLTWSHTASSRKYCRTGLSWDQPLVEAKRQILWTVNSKETFSFDDFATLPNVHLGEDKNRFFVEFGDVAKWRGLIVKADWKFLSLFNC